MAVVAAGARGGADRNALTVIASPGVAAAVGGVAAAAAGAASVIGVAAGIGIAMALIVALVTVRRPYVGAYILAALAPAVSGLRRGLPVPGFRLSEVLIGGIGLLIIATAARSPRLRWRLFDYAALAYAITTVVFGVFNVSFQGHGSLFGSLGTIVGPFQFLLLYRAMVVALVTPEQRRLALRLLLISSIPVATLALLQQFGVGNVRHTLDTLTSSNLYAKHFANVPRATGPFPHWHELGGFLMVTILLGVGLLLEDRQRVLRRSILVPILALALAALVQTASLTPLIGVIVGVLVIGFWSRRLAQVLAGLAVIAAVVAIFFAPLLGARLHDQFHPAPTTQRSAVVPQTIAFRYYVWRHEFEPILSPHLLTGYGTEPPATLSFGYTESLYVTLILRGGLPLLLVYFGLVAALLVQTRPLLADPDIERRVVARLLTILFVMLIFMHLFISYFVDSGLPHLLWILAGVAFGAGTTTVTPLRPTALGAARGR
jgi:O-antigen ligase/polysaccharide polymerase Wzy-like membrane protein